MACFLNNDIVGEILVRLSEVCDAFRREVRWLLVFEGCWWKAYV